MLQPYISNFRTPQEQVLRAIFLSGYVRRTQHESIRESTAALLYRFQEILLRYYRNGQSEQGVDSLAYIQLYNLLEQVCIKN